MSRWSAADLARHYARRSTAPAAKRPVPEPPPRADRFLDLLREHHLPAPQTEYRFAPPRRWRFDYCWPERLVALEQEGGVWSRGRHSRGAGMVKDMEKYNAATLAGWAVFRFTPQQLASGAALPLLTEVLG